MKFLSFLNDLGIIPNKGTQIENDPSLKQGVVLNDYNRHIIRNELPYLNSLQQTGIPNVDSIVESMDVADPKVRNNNRPNDDISTLEDKFNRVLAKYNSTYKLFTESVLASNKVDKHIQQYFGQAVTTTDGNYSYINDYGFTQKYSMDAWSNNNVSCPTNAISIDTNTYNTLKNGADMGQGQPCGIAGKNIQNSKSKEHAWVDIKGYKHVYSLSLWKKKSPMCNIPVITLSEEDYNSIPNGGNMSSTDTCMQLDIDPAIWAQLMQENDELLHVSKELASKFKNLVSQDVALQETLTETQRKLGETIYKVSNDRKQINSMNNSFVTINAEYQDTDINKNMNYLHMIVWFFVLLTVLSITVHAFISPESKTGDVLGLIFAFILLFVVVKWFWNKFSN